MFVAYTCYKHVYPRSRAAVQVVSRAYPSSLVSSYTGFAFQSYWTPSYIGPTGHSGRCWLQVYERRGALPVVLGGKRQPRREHY